VKFAIRQSPPVSLAQQKAWGLGQEQEQEQRRQVSVVRLWVQISCLSCFLTAAQHR
jgi:hypothetical protein